MPLIEVGGKMFNVSLRKSAEGEPIINQEELDELMKTVPGLVRMKADNAEFVGFVSNVNRKTVGFQVLARIEARITTESDDTISGGAERQT